MKRIKCFDQPIFGVFHAGGSVTGPLPAGGIGRSLAQVTSWGRGTSIDEARDSCLGEALEFYCAAHRGDEATTRGHVSIVPGSIDPRGILLFSNAQYQQRAVLGQHHSPRHAIPEQFNPCLELDWLLGIDQVDGTEAFVPAACCLLGYQFGARDIQFAHADRSGLATGLSRDQALAGALLELIEHDAVAIWWYNRIHRPATRLDTFHSRTLSRVSQELETVGRRLWLLELTTDLQIPTYVAVSSLKDGSQILFGAAADPAPRIAAEKAATEVAQLLMCSRIAQMPPDAGPWLQSETVQKQPHMSPAYFIDAAPEPVCLTARQTVELCTRRMAEKGIHPIAVDLSRNDVLVRALRVVAPGMRSICNRRAPGRLYDVPVSLGWLTQSLTEEELNPTNCIF